MESSPDQSMKVSHGHETQRNLSNRQDVEEDRRRLEGRPPHTRAAYRRDREPGRWSDGTLPEERQTSRRFDPAVVERQDAVRAAAALRLHLAHDDVARCDAE